MLRDEKEAKQGNSMKQVTCYLLRDGSLLGLFFDPEDGSKMFLRKVG
jgi:hypothetical protein